MWYYYPASPCKCGPIITKTVDEKKQTQNAQMASLKDLKSQPPQVDYGSYQNYSQTTHQPEQTYQPYSGQGQYQQTVQQQQQQDQYQTSSPSAPTSLATFKDPRTLAAICAGFGVGLYAFTLVRTNQMFVSPLIFLNVIIIAAGLRIAFADGKLSQYITEYSLPKPTIKPSLDKTFTIITHICYIISCTLSAIAIVLIITFLVIIISGDIDDRATYTTFCIFGFVFNGLMCYFSYLAFVLERASLKQWPHIYPDMSRGQSSVGGQQQQQHQHQHQHEYPQPLHQQYQPQQQQQYQQQGGYQTQL
jgi:hypothetical protein